MCVDSLPGRGSRFAVVLPRALPELRADSAAAPAPCADRLSMLAGAQIALIDDEVAVVMAMRALFSAWGAKVIAATSGDALLAELGEAERYPDLIIADYRLARGELGTQLIERVRSELGLQIPALLISGDSSLAALEAMRASGCDVLVKPVLPEELKQASTRLLAARAAPSLSRARWRRSCRSGSPAEGCRSDTPEKVSAQTRPKRS
jgi:two-component system, sensor histidine kinase